MSKPKSYGITPRQTKANKDVYKASHVVLESFGILIGKGEFEALISELINEGLKILKDENKAHKMLLDRCIKLSAENDALKMICQSTEQERKDSEQNRKYMIRLLDKIQTLEK